MKTIFIYLSSMLIFLACACEEDGGIFEDEQRITGIGKYETESIPVNDFTSVDLEHVANVYISTGKAQKVTFTAYENILPFMDARVIGNELVLNFSEQINVNTDREIRIDITMPELDEVTLSGVGNFYIEGPPQSELEINLDGVGNIDALKLQVKKCSVDINGTGNVQVDVKEELSVDIDGLGNVYYQGSPELNIDINGLGEVIRD